MDTFEKKLKRLLEEIFSAPDQVELEGQGRIIGKIISDRFKGMNSMERVDMIWDFLEERLTKKERSKIVVILAVTPKEELLHSVT